MKIIVIGAGAWGTGLALAGLRRGHAVRLMARRSAQVAQMRAERANPLLPDVALPAELALEDLAELEVLPSADLIVLAQPMSGLREALARFRGVPAPVVWACKGFEAAGALGHEIAREVAPTLDCGVLSGPSFALEVARGKPGALVAASPSARVREAAVAAFHGADLRVYENADWIGVEVGGAVKNVIAIATGLCDGLNLGLNARAALVTRGLAEITRLGLALGARAETFMGLSGLGDLVLTATGDLSRNRRVGLELASGKPLSHIAAELGHVAEGVLCARSVLARAQGFGLDMPITESVVGLLDGQLSAAQAVAQLMGREAKSEA
jgi:glycerol-3-phosphate dehydrogenase (NAD(P)+)